MCYKGTYKIVKVINKEQSTQEVLVDACIADEIQWLNDIGVITLGSCCSHGWAGKLYEWDAPPETGKNIVWRTHLSPPTVLLKEESVELARKHGYLPYPYYYADGNSYGVWQMQLKTGCLTEEDCKRFYEENKNNQEIIYIDKDEWAGRIIDG